MIGKIGIASRGASSIGIAGNGIRQLSKPDYPPFLSDAIWYARSGLKAGTDVDVNDLISPPIVSAAKYVNNPCLYLDGTSYANAATTYVGGTTYGILANIDSTGAGTNRVIFSFGSSLARILVRSDNIFQVGSTAITGISSVPYRNSWHHYSVTTSGNNVTGFYINGNLVFSTNEPGIGDGANRSLYIGARPQAMVAGLFFKGSVMGFSVGSNIAFTMGEGNGTVLYNRLGTGNHATVFNSTLPVLWGQTQSVKCFQQQFGFSLYEN